MNAIIFPKASTILPMLALSLACAGCAVAQQPQMDTQRLATPTTRVQSCAQVDIAWNLDLITQYPRIPEACHEVVTNSGIKWARFEANFVRINGDGSVTSDFKSPSGRSIGRYTMVPAEGQMVTLDGRKVPFSTLRADQKINLYVPEGAGSLAFEPGAPTTAYSRIVRYEDAPEPLPTRTEEPVQYAQVDRTPDRSMDRRLPDTAGPLPWLAVGGLMSLFGALGLRITRRRG